MLLWLVSLSINLIRCKIVREVEKSISKALQRTSVYAGLKWMVSFQCGGHCPMTRLRIHIKQKERKLSTISLYLLYFSSLPSPWKSLYSGTLAMTPEIFWVLSSILKIISRGFLVLWHWDSSKPVLVHFSASIMTLSQCSWQYSLPFLSLSPPSSSFSIYLDIYESKSPFILFLSF